jgi:putative ABC transport system ATP-binding protein
VLCGPSGSGKTTLLNLLGLIDRPDKGQLMVLGTDVSQLSDAALSDFRRDHIGYIFQNFNLLPVLTAQENVEYPLAIAATQAGERRRRAAEALAAVGLSAVAAHLPGQLSGGQRQRVAIARALVKRPQLILADEPTANLDARNGAAIIELLRQLQREQRLTIVVSSHDQFVQAQADHHFELRDGQLVGTPDTASGGPARVLAEGGVAPEMPRPVHPA